MHYNPRPHNEVKKPRSGSRTDIERRMYWARHWQKKGVRPYPMPISVKSVKPINKPIDTKLWIKIGNWLFN